MIEINEDNCIRVWNAAFDGALSVLGVSMADARNAEDIASATVIKFLSGGMDNAKNLETFGRKTGANEALNSIKRDKILHSKAVDINIILENLRQQNSKTLEDVIAIANKLTAIYFTHARPTRPREDIARVIAFMMLKDRNIKPSEADFKIFRSLKQALIKYPAIKADFYKTLTTDAESVDFAQIMGEN